MPADNNVVQIILQAQDNASKVIQDGSAKVAELSEAAAVAAKQVFALNSAFVTIATGGGLSALKEATTAIGSLKRALSTPVGTQLVDSVKEIAEEAIATPQKLSTVLNSVTGSTTPLLEGLILGDSNKTQEKARVVAGSIGKEITGNLFAATKGLGDIIAGAIGNKDLASKFGGEAFAGLVGKGLSQGLNFGLDSFIKSKLPAGLGVINDALAGGIKELSIPLDAKQLLQGDFFAGLESLLSNRLGDAFVDSIQQLDTALVANGGNFEKAGELAGKIFGDGFRVSGVLKDALVAAVPENIPQIGGLLKGVVAGALGNETFDGVFKNLDKGVATAAKSLVSGNGLFKAIREGFLAAFSDLDKASEGLLSEVGTRAGTSVGLSFAKGFANKALDSVGQVANAIDDRILKTVSFVESLSGKLAGPLSGASGVFGGIAGFGEPLEAFEGLQKITVGVTGSIVGAVSELGRFSEGLETLKAIATNGPFELLVGQTVKLREQLLATQSTLAGTNKVVQDGLTVSDPTQAIQSLTSPVNQAIAALRKGSLELVGVTSKDLVEAFQIVAGKAGQIGYSLQDATKLTLSFSAAMGTLGIPIFQARQEIGSVLNGLIDQNSVLAKSLGLTNEMIGRWKSQGTLVEQLNKRLEAFRAGNALAAQTLGGITSNIQELFDEIGRLAGEQLLDPILKQLQSFYSYLNENKDALAQGIGDLVGQLLKAGEAAVEAFKSAFGALQGFASQIPDYLVSSLANAIKETAGAIQTTVEILRPALDIFAELAKNAAALGGPFLKLFLQFKVLETGIRGLGSSFGILAQTLPGVGELLFFLEGRSHSLINTFASLTSTIGQGGAGFLLLGKHLNSIPGAAGLVASKLGPLGPLIAGIIPSAAGLGIQLVGLSKQFPPVGAALKSLAGQAPTVLNSFAGLISSSSVAGGAFAAFAPSIQRAAKELGNYTQGVDVATLLNRQFADVAKQAGIAVRQQIISFGLLAGGVFAAIYIFDNFVLKNKSALKALEDLGKKLQEVGKFIYQITGIEKIGNAIATVVEKIATALTVIVSNPFALATTGAIAFGIALKLGVLGPIVQIAEAIKKVDFGDIKFPTEKAKEFTSQLSEVISGSSGQKTKQKQSDGLKQSLTESADQYKQAIADRKAKIAEIDKQIPDAQANPFGNPEKLAADREAITKELNEITEVRKKQGRELANLKKEAASTPSVSIGQRASGTATQVRGTIAASAGAGVAKLGEAIASVGLDGLGDRLSKTGDKLKDFGQKSLESAAAQTGLINNAKLANAAADGFAGTLTKARGAIVGFVGGIVSAAGPIVLLTAAIAAVTEALTIYGEITNAQEQPLKDYNEGLEEQRSKLEEILRLRGKLKEAGDVNPEKPQSTEDRRREEIKGQQGFVTNAIDFIGKQVGSFASSQLGVAGALAPQDKVPSFKDLRADATFNAGVIGQSEALKAASDDLAKYKASLADIKKTTEEINKERKRRAELDATRANIANSGGDTKAIEDQIKGVDDSIKKREEEIQVRKNLADESVKGLEKQKLNTDELKGAQRGLITQLKEVRGEMEAIGSTKILPQDLPRRGTTFEQFQTQASQAESVVTKSGGDQAQFDAQAKQLVAVTRQQLELKQITEEEARRRAEIIANNSRVEVATQVEAQKLITDSFKAGTDDRAVLVEKETAEVERQVAEGVLTQEDGQVKITEIKQRELDKQLGDLTAQRGEEVAREKAATEEILKEIDRRSNEARLKLAQARGDQAATGQAADALIGQLTPKKDDLTRQAGGVEAVVARLKAIAPASRTAEQSQELSQAEAKLGTLKQGIGDIDQKIEELNKAKSAAPGKLDTGGVNAAQAEIDQLGKDREKAASASRDRITKINNQYDAKESQNRAEAAKDDRQKFEDQYKDSLNKIQALETASQAEIENKRRNGQISSAQADQEQFNATKKRITDEIKLQEDRVKQLSGQKGREADIATAQKRIVELQKEGDKAEEDLTKGKLERIQELEASAQLKIAKLKESGAIDGEEADRRLYLSTQARIDAEIKAEEEKLARLSKRKGNEKEIGDSEKRIVELKKQSADNQIKEIDRVAQKSIDLSKAAETERLIQIQKLRNSGAISKEDAEELRVVAAKKTIEDELALERQKLQQLEGLRNRDERAIRTSRLRVLDLTKQSLEQEEKLQEAYIRKLEDNLNRRIKPEIEAQEAKVNQQLERQLQLMDLINKSLEIRTKLLKASQDLGNAANEYLDQELQILSEGEVGEYRKKELAQATAAIKLQAAREQIALETQIFKIQQEQNRLALERKVIENDIAIAKKQAEIAKGQGELGVAQEKLKSGQITQQEYNSLSVQQQGRFLELGALQKESGLIQREKALQAVQERAEQLKFDLQNRAKLGAAELEFAKATPDVGERRRNLEQLGERRAQEQGFGSRDEYVQELIRRARGASEATFSDRGDRGQDQLRGLTDRILPEGVRDLQKSLGKAADDIRTYSNTQFKPELDESKSSTQIELERLRSSGFSTPSFSSPSFAGDFSKVLTSLSRGQTGFSGGAIGLNQPGQSGQQPGQGQAPPKGAIEIVMNNKFEIKTDDKAAGARMQKEVLKQFDTVTKKAQQLANSTFN